MFTVLRRAQHALREHELAREQLDIFFSGKRSTYSYFLALSHLEVAISCCYQAFEFVSRATGSKLFVKGDGSEWERLNRIYSVVKHLEASSLLPKQLHLLWFSDTGLHSSTDCLAFSEINDFVGDLCEMADRLSNLKEGG